MNEKHCLKEFISDIDKIIAGESIIPSEYADNDEEYKELLNLAQVLAKADYTPEIQGGQEKRWSVGPQNGELADDDLDMVAGGVNLNGLLDEKNNRK